MTSGHSLGCMCPDCLKRKRFRATLDFQRPAPAGAATPAHQGACAVRGEAGAGYPTKSVGVCPPLGNTGETYNAPTAETVELVVDGGRIKEVTRRVPAMNECAVIDTLRFTIHQSTFIKTQLLHGNALADVVLAADDSLIRMAETDPDIRHCVRQAQVGSTIISDDDYVREASRVFADIFGFGVTKFTGKGRDFYRDAHVLGENFGYVCIGNAGKNNQQGTMLVELSGQGCLHAKAGWEKRLFDFLRDTANRPVITRIDLCHDDMTGELHSPDWAEAQWLAGGFTKCVGKDPNIERAGNWHKPTGAGRTLYIGSRKHSSMFVREYEKGKEQGDPDSPWNRLELEIKNADRVIPLDILVRPSDYFVAAYPALEIFSSFLTPERIAVKKQKAEIGVAAAKEIVKHQFGKYLRVLRDLYDGDGNKLLDELVCDDPSAWPERLKVLGASHDTFEGTYLHDIPLMKWDIDTGCYVPAVADNPALQAHGFF